MQKLTFNTILRYALIAGIFIIPFIPFIVAKSMFFPFIVGKNFTFRIIVELIFGGWLIIAWRDARYRPQFSWILAAYALFLGITLVSDLFGENLFRSFWSNFERMDGLVGYLHFFVYFLIISSVLNTEKLWTRFFQTTLGASVLMAIYSFFQLAGYIVINQGGARIDATLGNASYLGLYALFHVFIAAFLFAKEKSRLWRIAYSIIAALNLIVLYNTATRGAILGLIGGAFITALLIAVFEREWDTRRKIAVSCIAGIVLFAVSLIFLRDAQLITNNPVLARVVSVTRVGSVIEEMSASRFRIWEMSWKGFQEHPILGWGQENFNLVFSKYYDPRMAGQEPWFDRAHNVVFDRLIDGGALGFLSYLSIFFATLYCLWRGKRSEKEIFTTFEKSIFTGLLAAYFFQNLFIFDQFVSYFLFFSVLAFIHARAVMPQEGERAHDNFSKKDYAIMAVILLTILSALYILNINGIRANQTLLNAMRPQQEGIAKNLAYFNKALAYDRTVGIVETREQLAEIVARTASQPIDNAIKEEFFVLAKSEMQKQINIQPNDARYRMFIANLYSNFGAYEDAVFETKKGIEISPNKEHLYYILGNLYLSKGEFEKAFETLRIPFELFPNARSRKFFAAAAVYAKKDELAAEILKPLNDPDAMTDSLFVNAYITRGQFNKVAEIWEKRIISEPDNLQNYLSLGAAYAKDEQYAKAIETIKKAIEIAPEFQRQGEELIRRIRIGDI